VIKRQDWQTGESMIKISKKIPMIARALLYSSLIIVPLMLPIFFILLPETGEEQRNGDFQILIERDSLKEDFTRFYPRKFFHVGIFIDNIFDLNMGNQTFKSNFIFWAKNFFDRSPNDRSQLGTNPFNIINAAGLEVQDRAVRYIKKPNPQVSPNDDNDPFVSYVSYTARGELNQEFYLRHYPFDEHKLKIIIEPAKHTAEDMILGVDPTSLLSGNISLSSWEIISFNGYSELSTKRSDFSDPVLIEKGSIWHIIPQATFSITLKRKFLPHLIKEMLPLFTLLLLGYANFFVHPREMEVRIGMAVTGFLTAAAIHWTVASNLPGVGYLTAMDEFFLYSYALFFLIGVESVVAHVALGEDEEGIGTGPAGDKKPHPWFRYGLPTLRIIYPLFLVGTWYSVIFRHLN